MRLETWLITAFDYDVWANKRWLNRIGTMPDPQRATEVFEHILTAQRVWLERCGVAIELQKSDQATAAILDQIAGGWRYFLERTDLNELITYQNYAGQTFRNTVSEIALHVINHGTYHRGHLRGLADQGKGAEFEDTDLILFFRDGFPKPVS